MKNHIVKTFKLFIQYLIILTPILIIQSASNYANATVISSVKPIGFITQAITSGITDAEILLPDGASPHTYSLKPSDLKNIKSAELVIWVGEDMETFMPTLLKNIDKQKQIELMEIPAIKTLLRTNHDDHSHEEINHHQSDHDHHGEYDEHIWLSPEIAKIIAQSIHDKLITLYPDKKIKIDENLNEFTIKLSETEQNIAKKLINVQNRGYFVFHDAYGYFESQFRLKNLGSFTINPAVQPGAQKVYAIQQKLKEHQAVCVFIEPQFSPAVIEKLVNGTNVRIGELNPLGTDIMPSKDAYFQFLMKLTQQLLDCLDK
ncbi:MULTISPECIES: zinc ABC transporter substrate-binding protein ZnuA [unclassified Gilliamella]|uniref:zinc ABC transporter substrate-binding protein ZnuA n=1 Tax=unclassified Gilliamella TaxID=2685620 RepID=UPI0022698777|nr:MULTISPECIES: zinc ABC transporter substrate-binding protein ZnuA [unclassified Gilliamella]MCX8573794.1 zinc ABC transporter substrate-binding protein ZnuA [Gilliamella sp. B3831]MCX8576024.1 zinc ABC transporter substrate-binding protein ZnuA [Gilliamella sp. B3815]MCX8579191.1 zinc ABC transporter substrate-binding protein ZnuA [Gilliamella sp. B2717]MCX8587937.1 zinc ABC transporter substrate-binding protein ZnuA [Gilliamella sp. B3801]MCX8590534.1 zinc ABC transporter substrate-binding